MIEARDSIESSGFPLAFKTVQGSTRSPVLAGGEGSDVFRVEARALGAHQKEAVVWEGDHGSAWRLTSDEGAYLKGSDLAPFPLGFFNAGLQADYLQRLAALAGARGVALGELALELDNHYAFSGSFLKGEGRGSAFPARLRLAVSDKEGVEMLAREALQASPVLAAMRVPLQNTFALYVNGVRRAVTQARASSAADAPDPLKRYRQVPRPLGAGKALAGLIEKIPQPAAESAVMPEASAKIDIVVKGASRLTGDGTAAIETWLPRPAGSRFAFRASIGQSDAAPSGLALASAGVAFCYLTQLLRYTEYLSYKVRAMRVVQYNPYALLADGRSWKAEAGPVDTHLFLHGDEPDEVMQKLLAMGARTCYLHAALAAALAPELEVLGSGHLP